MYSQMVTTYFYFDQFSTTYLTLFLLLFSKTLDVLTRFGSVDPSQIASSSPLN